MLHVDFPQRTSNSNDVGCFVGEKGLFTLLLVSIELYMCFVLLLSYTIIRILLATHGVAQGTILAPSCFLHLHVLQLLHQATGPGEKHIHPSPQ